MTIRTDTIVTRYEVSTINHEQGVDRIRQKQQQLQQQLKDWNAEAQRMEKVHADAWKSVAIGVAGVGVAIVAAKASFTAYANTQRLTSAAAGADISRLSEAAGGLRTKIELLEFAAKAQHGAFKLSTDQMAMAQRAMRELTREGYDQEEVTKKVTDAIIKLEGDGLKDFGIRVREAKTDGEKFQAVMDALAGSASKLDESSTTGAESIQQLGVRFEDAAARIKTSLGEVVVAMAPLISAVATLAEKSAGLISTITEGWGGLASMMGGREAFLGYYGYKKSDFDSNKTDGSAYEEFLAAGNTQADWIASKMGQHGPGTAPGPMTGIGGTSQPDDTLERIKQYEEAQAKKWWLKKAAGPTGPSPYQQYLSDRAKEYNSSVDSVESLRDQLIQAAWAKQAPQGQDSAGRAADYLRQAQSFMPDLYAAQEKVSRGSRYEESAGRRNQTQLEKMFGPLESFDAYKQAFDTLSGASTAALSAWIDGSASAGEAFKKFVSEALKGLASQMLVESLKHAAYALGSLAFGDLGGAAKHGAAAAAFGAGAGIAAVAARELGGGASAHGAGSGAAGYSSGGGVAPSGGPQSYAGGQQVTIVYGDSMADDSPRARDLKARRIVDRALGATGVVDG